MTRYVIKQKQKAPDKTVPMAWSYKGLAKDDRTWLQWSPETAAAFMDVVTVANVGRDLNLPIGTLRTALASAMPQATLLLVDLAGIGFRSQKANKSLVFAHCVGGSHEDAVKTAIRATRLWISEVLNPWALKHGIPGEIMERLRVAVKIGVVAHQPQGWDAKPYLRDRDAIFHTLSQKLKGVEIFGGMGPLLEEVRAKDEKSLSFITWPKRHEDSNWSMVLTFKVETMPGRPQPIVVMSLGRRRWCKDIPSEKELYNEKRLYIQTMSKEKNISVATAISLKKGTYAEIDDPALILLALDQAENAAFRNRSLKDMMTASENMTIGIAVQAGFKEAKNNNIGNGATELDYVECFEKAGELIGAEFEPMTVSKLDKLGFKQAMGNHAKMDLEKMIAWSMADTGDSTAARQWIEMVGAGDIEGKKAIEIEAIRKENVDRIKATYREEIPNVVVISATEEQNEALMLAIDVLFGGSIAVTSKILPEGVHGNKRHLPHNNGYGSDRFEARVRSWRPLAEAIAGEVEKPMILVQAAIFYDGVKDDKVNKPAARIALATHAGANVQYLDTKSKSPKNYLMRIQSAISDLLFGHAGAINDISEAVNVSFQGETERPKIIIGFSILQTNKTSRDGAGATILMMTRTDLESGIRTARLGRRMDGVPEWSPEVEMREVLKIAARWSNSTIGDKNVRQETYKGLVGDVVKEACTRGERPLVLFDSTSAARCWSYLSDQGYDSFDAAQEWPGARVVRIRTGIAPKIVTDKHYDYTDVDADTGEIGASSTFRAPTILRGLYEVNDDSAAPHYFSAGSMDGKQQIPKGLSVLKEMEYAKIIQDKHGILPVGIQKLKLAKKSNNPRSIDKSAIKDSYKSPNSIEITILHHLEKDDVTLIALLVDAMREGFGHARGVMELPSPIFFGKKVKQYIPSFAIEDADDMDDDETEKNGEVAAPAEREIINVIDEMSKAYRQKRKRKLDARQLVFDL